MGIGAAQWRAEAELLRPHSGIFIDGGFRQAASGQTFTSTNPASGEVVAEVAAGDQPDVELAVAAARRAFSDGRWAGLSPAARKKRLLRLADLIEQRARELALLDSLEMGKPVVEAHAIDVPGAAGVFAWHAEATDKVNDEIAPTGPGAVALVRREPLGVVGAVVPWNFPLDLAAWKVAPALAAGNSVVLKPAEQSSLSALKLAGLAAEAGIPDGVLNVVPGFGETAGQALGRHPDVDCLAFTGSTQVGRLFQKYAAAAARRRWPHRGSATTPGRSARPAPGCWWTRLSGTSSWSC